MKEEFYLFWGGNASQWLESPFTVFDIEFDGAEQFMMASKAKCFKDEDSYEKIMATPNPNEQKALGRKVKNFNDTDWFEVAFDVVVLANFNKFMQNEDLLVWLIETYDTHERFVEASPYDVVWGIGMGADDPRALDETQWQGQNLLGKAIDAAHELITNTSELDIREIESRVEKMWAV